VITLLGLFILDTSTGVSGLGHTVSCKKRSSPLLALKKVNR
jgi:hypothetical protein